MERARCQMQLIVRSIGCSVMLTSNPEDSSKLSDATAIDEVEEPPTPGPYEVPRSPCTFNNFPNDSSTRASKVAHKLNGNRESAFDQLESDEALNDARRSSIDLTRPAAKKLVGMESFPTRIAMELLKIDRIKEIRGVDSESLNLAKQRLKSARILYIFGDHDSLVRFTKKNKSNTFAPKWFEPDDYFQYTRDQYNTIIVGEEGIDLIIDFVAINCPQIEAIYSEVVLPFSHFATRLGPRMHFFRGLDPRFRWLDYDTLSCFSNLQFMRGYGSPCYYQRLAHNLPVTVIDDFGLAMANKCGGCIKRVFSISRELGIQLGRIRRGLPLPYSFDWSNSHPEASIDSIFASKIKEITLIHHHQGQAFFFPNLVSLNLRSPKHSTYFKSIEYSVKLRSLELTLALNRKCLDKLGKLVSRLPELRLFFLFNYLVEGNTFPDLKVQETFLTKLVTSCGNLENLVVPFVISISSVKQLIRLRNLLFLGVEKFPMDSSIGFFANTRGNRINRITITENKEQLETFDGSNIFHSALMKCYENRRYEHISINYVDACTDESCPLKKFISSTVTSVRVTHQEPE